MRLKLEFHEAGDLLHCIASGPYSLADFLRLADQVNERRRARGLSQVLVDITGVTGEIPSLDRYRLGIYVAERPNRARRLAVIARREIINWMFENVASNRGVPTCVTADPRFAENWLRAAA